MRNLAHGWGGPDCGTGGRRACSTRRPNADHGRRARYRERPRTRLRWLAHVRRESPSPVWDAIGVGLSFRVFYEVLRCVFPMENGME